MILLKSVGEIVLKVAKKSINLAFALIVTISIIFILYVLYCTDQREVEDDYYAGLNSFYAMRVVDDTAIEDIDVYLYEHDGNRTNTQYACGDDRAISRLLPIFGTDYVTEACDVVGVPIN